MENYKVRMLHELLELDRRIYDLSRFIASGADGLSKEQVELMKQQCEVMSTYAKVLIERLSLELEG